MKEATAMINNLKSASGAGFGASKALEYLTLSKQATGRPERELLVEMVLYSIETSPEYSFVRELFISDASSERRAKRCLTVMRKMRGQSEQSLLSSLVKYAFENNPSFRGAAPGKTITETK